MTRHKRLPHILLYATFALALAGLYLCLDAGRESVYQLLFTILFTGALAAILVSLQKLADRTNFRAAARTAMLGILIIWICAMLLTWTRDWLEDAWTRIAMTLLITIPTGFPAAFALPRTRVNRTRTAAWSFVALAALTWLVDIIATWFTGELEILGDNLSSKLLLSATALYAFGIPCTLLLINLGRDRRYFRFPAIALGLAAMAVAIYAIWTDRTSETWWRLSITGLTLTFVFAHINLLLTATAPSTLLRSIRWATIILSCISGALISITLFTDPRPMEELHVLPRAGAAAAILAAAGTLALLILPTFRRRIRNLHDLRHIILLCPRCHVRQTLPLGNAVCHNCQLEIITRVVESRCTACGYDLHNLTSNRCPECGTPTTYPISDSPYPPEHCKFPPKPVNLQPRN